MSTSAQPDSTHPIGYTFRAIHSYGSGHTRLQHGDVGEVIGTDPKKPAWVRTYLPENGQTYWVPKNRIQISNVKVGEIRTDVASTPVTLTNIPLTSVATDQITSAFSGILQAIQQAQPSFMQPWWNEALGANGHQIAAVTSRVAEGLNRAGLRSTLNSLNFSWKDIRDNALHITATNAVGRKGIYMRFLYNVEDDPDAAHLYIGSSGDVSRRAVRHAYSAHDPNDEDYHNSHYQATRSANKVDTMALCLFDEDQNAAFLRVAEQAFILLFESYNDEVLVHQSDPRLNLTTSEEVIEEVLQKFHNSDTATSFTQIADQARSRTNWPGGRRTRASFGVTQGHNLSSPMTEGGLGGERTLWFRTEGVVDGARVANFQGATPFRTYGKKDSISGVSYVVLLTMHGTLERGRGDLHIEVNAEDQPLPPVDALVRVVFELQLDGQVHDLCWARLPLVGCFDDWAMANALALRIEWTVGDQRMTRYIQTSRHREPLVMDASANGSLSRYGWATALVRFFTRQAPEEPRPWEKDFGLARMRQIEFDYYNQTLRISEELPPDPIRSSNAKRGEAEMIVEMADFGLTNCGRSWQSAPDLPERFRSGRGRAGMRIACDTCMITEQRRPDEVCVRRDGTDYCQLCLQRYGRPCSWTHHRLLVANDANSARIMALVGPDRDPQASAALPFDP